MAVKHTPAALGTVPELLSEMTIVLHAIESQDPLEPLPMRVERPPADEIPPPPAYLEACVRRPTAGIGPEARLTGLDERTELRIVVPRCVPQCR